MATARGKARTQIPLLLIFIGRFSPHPNVIICLLINPQAAAQQYINADNQGGYDRHLSQKKQVCFTGHLFIQQSRIVVIGNRKGQQINQILLIFPEQRYLIGVKKPSRTSVSPVQAYKPGWLRPACR
jgi:hypothetical protein